MDVKSGRVAEPSQSRKHRDHISGAVCFSETETPQDSSHTHFKLRSNPRFSPRVPCRMHEKAEIFLAAQCGALLSEISAAAAGQAVK